MRRFFPVPGDDNQTHLIENGPFQSGTFPALCGTSIPAYNLVTGADKSLMCPKCVDAENERTLHLPPVDPLPLGVVSWMKLSHEPYSEGESETDDTDVWCSNCEQQWPCEVQQLIATIQTLTVLPEPIAPEEFDVSIN